MTHIKSFRIQNVIALIIYLVLVGTALEEVSAAPPPEDAVTVQAVASQGAAAPGNNLNANLLVLVTDRRTGLGTSLADAIGL